MFWFLHYSVKVLIGLAIVGMLCLAYANRELLTPAEEWMRTLERADLGRLEILGTNTARVVKANAGDTLTVGESRTNRLTFRIAGVVAPPVNRHRNTPSWQAFEDSRVFLDRAAASNEVVIAYTYLVPGVGGVGGVYLGGTNLALTLLDSGMAVVHDASLKSLPLPEQVLLLAAEKKAREARRGVWSKPAVLSALKARSPGGK